MNISETNTPSNYGILPICCVNDCVNYISKKEGGIVHECCKLEHYETLRPCKYYEKPMDMQ